MISDERSSQTRNHLWLKYSLILISSVLKTRPPFESEEAFLQATRAFQCFTKTVRSYYFIVPMACRRHHHLHHDEVQEEAGSADGSQGKGDRESLNPGKTGNRSGRLKRHKSDAVLVWHTTAPPNNHFSSNIGSGVSILKPWRVSSSSLFSGNLVPKISGHGVNCTGTRT